MVGVPTATEERNIAAINDLAFENMKLPVTKPKNKFLFGEQIILFPMVFQLLVV